MIQIVSRAEAGREAWDRVVESSPDAWVWGLFDWQDLILQVPRWQLEEASFALIDDGQVVAAVPLQWSPAAKRLSGSGWGLTAPALAADHPDRAVLARAAYAHVMSVAAQRRATRIEFALSPVTRSSAASIASGNPFVPFGFTDESSHARVLDLRQPEEALLGQFSRDARQQIRKATAVGITARQVSWADYLERYYEVHSATYIRTGETPHPREYFEGIATRMAPRGNSVLWAAFEPGGGVIAFHNTARLGSGAMYHTGCSLEPALETGANYLAFWSAIRGAREAGCDRYELGEVFVGDVTGKKRGLTTFKSKFGGEIVPFYRAGITLPSEAAPAPTAETSIRDAYERGGLYDPSRICRKVRQDSGEYVDRLLADKFAMVRDHDRGGRLVDLCCAAGEHLVEAAADREDTAVGVDFSFRYLEQARERADERAVGGVSFVQGDARQLPLSDESVSLLYCFSSLYAIPGAEAVVGEVGRILAPGGTAVLDFGNRRSLNVFCLSYYTEWPAIQPLTLAQIDRAIAVAGLTKVRHRRFQLLPLWADRPGWLAPLLHPRWKALLKRRWRGRMLDEWLSSLPLLRAFAFRHVIVCQKTAASQS